MLKIFVRPFAEVLATTTSLIWACAVYLQACALSAHSAGSMRNFEFRAGKSVNFGAGTRRNPQRTAIDMLPTFLRASVFLVPAYFTLTKQRNV